MAEKIRNVEEIMTELFEGLRIPKRDGTTRKEEAALKKYAKVRWVRFEIDYYRNGALPLEEIASQAKVYFSKRFLNGAFISSVDASTFEKAYSSLDHAVKDGCHGRCVRLVEELNEALAQYGVQPIEKIDAFLDWLTFWPVERRGDDGSVLMEKPYSVAVIDFHNDRHLNGFYKVWKSYFKKGVLLSMQDTYRIANILEKSRKLPPKLKTKTD